MSLSTEKTSLVYLSFSSLKKKKESWIGNENRQRRDSAQRWIIDMILQAMFCNYRIFEKKSLYNNDCIVFYLNMTAIFLQSTAWQCTYRDAVCKTEWIFAVICIWNLTVLSVFTKSIFIVNMYITFIVSALCLDSLKYSTQSIHFLVKCQSRNRCRPTCDTIHKYIKKCLYSDLQFHLVYWRVPFLIESVIHFVQFSIIDQMKGTTFISFSNLKSALKTCQ